MRALALILLSACTYDASDTAIWTGTITRDGAPVVFAGYDPFPSQGFEFGASPSTIGYIEDGGTKLLVQVILRLDDGFERDMVAPPLTLPIRPDADMPNETHLGVDYLEQPAADQDVDFDIDPTYEVKFSDHTPGSMTGNFTVTETDYRTFIVGHLFVQVTDQRSSVRGLDLDVHWLGQK
jgi:hypothetical protein